MTEPSATSPSQGQAPAPIPILGAPPLGLLAAIAALADLVINRIAVRAASGHLEPATVLAWMRYGALPRNLVGVAGTFALLAALGRYLRMPGFAPLYVRLPVAAFAGIMMATLLAAIALPRPSFAPHFVLFALFASLQLVCLFCFASVVYRGAFWLRVGIALVGLAALQALLVVALASIRAMGGAGLGAPLAWFARQGGELGWLLVPFALALALRPHRPLSRRDAAGLVAGVLTAAAVVALGVAGAVAYRPGDYATIAYGAFRVALLPERATVLYALPPAVGIGAATSGLLSADPWRRQVAAALVLWIAGGYAGRSPVQMLETVLASVLLARAAQAADPEGVRRARLGWTALRRRASPIGRPLTPSRPPLPPPP